MAVVNFTQNEEIGRLVPFRNAQDARTQAFAFGNSLNLVAGTVVGQVTATKKLKAYASGNSDGSEIPIGVLEYDVVTNATGKVQGYVGERLDYAFEHSSVFLVGEFKVSELTGLDANAITKLGRVFNSGTEGVLRMIR